MKKTVIPKCKHGTRTKPNTNTLTQNTQSAQRKLSTNIGNTVIQKETVQNSTILTQVNLRLEILSADQNIHITLSNTVG